MSGHWIQYPYALFWDDIIAGTLWIQLIKPLGCIPTLWPLHMGICRQQPQRRNTPLQASYRHSCWNQCFFRDIDRIGSSVPLRVYLHVSAISQFIAVITAKFYVLVKLWQYCSILSSFVKGLFGLFHSGLCCCGAIILNPKGLLMDRIGWWLYRSFFFFVPQDFSCLFLYLYTLLLSFCWVP